MKPQLFIFLGRSGCGKGTQTTLLTKHLSVISAGSAVTYVSTGEEFRKLITSPTYTGNRVKEIVDRGDFVPSFLAAMMWSSVIAKDYTEGSHMIIDGSPRTIAEKEILDTIHHFYGENCIFDFEATHVVYLNVSSEWATDKLLKRAEKEGRKDDTKEAIAKRMFWYENFVAKVIEAYKTDTRVSFHEINGEQTIEEVHGELISKVFHS